MNNIRVIHISFLAELWLCFLASISLDPVFISNRIPSWLRSPRLSNDCLLSNLTHRQDPSIIEFVDDETAIDDVDRDSFASGNVWVTSRENVGDLTTVLLSDKNHRYCLTSVQPVWMVIVLVYVFDSQWQLSLLMQPFLFGDDSWEFGNP